MAVQACIKPKMFDDGDDGSAIFKRNRTVSKQNKSNSEIKNSLSRRHEGSSGRQVSNVHGENTSPEGSKVDSLTKASTVKVSPTSSTASTLCADNSKKSSKQNSVRPEKKELNESHVETHVKTEDSEDDQPLSARFCAGLSKSNSNHVLNGLSSPTPSLSHSPKAKVSTKNSSDDSEDDIPLGLKLRLKANVGASSSKLPKSERLSSPAPSSSQPQKTKVSTKDFSDDSEDEIPLSLKFQLKATAMSSSSKSIGFDEKKPKASKLQLNGISKNANQLIKSPKGMNKRPLDEGDIAHHSSVKKPKLSDASVNGKVKQVSVKAETDNNDDYTPLSKSVKKSVPSNNKSASLKKKITKIASSFKKTTKKSKKFAKSLKYSKSTKLPPTSGEGQKWTTLVHNGIIFPPPYKPHGVKMPYNGHPVDLTPEQEEVATMFAVMKDTEYATRPRFIENFINDWRAILGKKTCY